MPGWLRHPVGAGIAALIVLILAAATFAIVPETEQVVVLRFEQPVRTVNAWQPGQVFGHAGAGLIARIPFVDRIVPVDKRVLDVDYPNQPVLSSDQQRLEVDAYARFRVTDPLRMVVTARSEEGVTEALRPLLGNAVRDELGKQPFAVLFTPDREAVMAAIRTRLQAHASQYGVQVVDVRIKHADLPIGKPLDSALASMRSARAQLAATIRAQGAKQAQIIQANADAQAASIYADAFGKDPGFYDFYRAMQSYKRSFGPQPQGQQQGTTSVVLSPNNGYLRQFEGRGDATGR